MPTLKKVLAPPKDLQKEIRDELRMTAAMRCYSIMRSGNAKSLQMQYETMSNLFHGDEPSIVSNIKMLCNGSYVYREIFDLEEVTEAITSKASQTTSLSQQPKMTLKLNLSRDKSRMYYANKDILRSDLEKKSRNGKQLVSGRSILEMAKKGTAYYRKALSFASKKFDLEKMAVIESGNSIEDVIEYVRIEMYQIILKEELAKRKTIVLDDDDVINDDDDNEELEDNYLESLKNKDNSSTNENSKTSAPSYTPKDNPTSDDQEDEKNCLNDENHNKNKTDKTILNNSTTAIPSNKLKKTKVQKVTPPENWFFPCWISFIAYGPFVEKSQRLPLLEITDASKDVVKSRLQKRKCEKMEKAVKRTTDETADRGYSTDQKIQLEMIDLSRKQTNDRGRESILMGLCIQEHALTKQIDRAERMADRRAPESMDDLSNKWWKKVDDLIKEQEKVISKIAEINNRAMTNDVKGVKKTQTSINGSKNSVLTAELTNTMQKASEVEVQSSFSKDDDFSLNQNNTNGSIDCHINTATNTDNITTVTSMTTETSTLDI